MASRGIQTSDQSPTSARHWLPWAGLGFLGALLVALMAFGVGYLEDGPRGVIERNAGWVRTSVGRYVARFSALIGSLLMFVAWWRLRPGPTADAPGMPAARRDPPFRAIGLAWTVPFWPVPALMTADAYAYAAQGWLLHQGLNPYEIAMGYPSPFAESVYPTWRPTTAVYPPLTLHLQHLIVDLTGAHPYWAPVAMRLLPLAGFVLMIAVAGPLARQIGASPAAALWFVALNPLLLIQFIGGAHNDGLMLGLILLAFWLARLGARQADDGRPHSGLVHAPAPAPLWALVAACVAIGVAAAVKQPAVLAGVGVVLYNLLGEHHRGAFDWRAFGIRLGLGGAVGAATFLALSAPRGLWFGWLGDHVGSPSLVINHSPLSWLAQAGLALGAPTGAVNTALTVVSAILTLVAIVLVTRRWAGRRPIRFTAGILLAFGLLGSALQPWYFLWGGPLLAFCHPRRRVIKLAGAVVLLLLVSGVLQEYLSPVLTVPIGAVLAYAWWRSGERLTGARQHN